MNSHLRPYNRCISNISTNIYLGLDLYPNISSKDEMREAIKGTLDYYINHYPQKRLRG